jgi:magnesium transporter
MLTRHPTGGDAPFWSDLLNPTDEEAGRVSTESGVRVPSLEALQEIETSSRLRADNGVLYASMPLANRDEAAGFLPVPLGFILSPQVLVTVRFSEIHAFAEVRTEVESGRLKGSAAVFVSLIDGMVDYAADMLEKRSADLASVSVAVFRSPGDAADRKQKNSRALRDTLKSVGSAGDHLSRIRESLLGLQRIVGFVQERAGDWMAPELKAHLGIARQDLASLVDFESHLSGKTQFLLDAILGFISTEQNDTFKVLTIASVVGIPPTIVTSLYGMNFHDMPELSWRWGYPYGLTLIALSTLLPILWFKRRGWW